jgi:hypothetical protein
MGTRTVGTVNRADTVGTVGTVATADAVDTVGTVNTFVTADTTNTTDTVHGVAARQKGAMGTTTVDGGQRLFELCLEVGVGLRKAGG